MTSSRDNTADGTARDVRKPDRSGRVRQLIDGGNGPSNQPIDELPPALSSMWRLCKLVYSHEPSLMLEAFFLSLLAALTDALLALWFKLLGQGVLQGNGLLVRVAAIALGVSAAATWFLRTVSTRVQRRFRDKVTIAL